MVRGSRKRVWGLEGAWGSGSELGFREVGVLRRGLGDLGGVGFWKGVEGVGRSLAVLGSNRGLAGS